MPAIPVKYMALSFTKQSNAVLLSACAHGIHLDSLKCLLEETELKSTDLVL